MSDDEQGNVLDTAKALNLGAVVTELYKDVVSPAAKEIGNGLQTVAKAANIALRPIAGLVWGYEKIEDYVLNELPKRLKTKKTEQIITPEPHLAGPLLESLKYTGYKDSLRDMYLNLLATSMDKDTASKAHPSFVEIIRQLSSDEAKLLSYFPSISGYPQIDSNWVTHNWWRHEVYKSIKNDFKVICKNAQVELPDLYLSYLDNLTRLKLIDFKQVIGQGKINTGRNIELKFEQDSHEYLFVTSLGLQFIEACLEDVGQDKPPNSSDAKDRAAD